MKRQIKKVQDLTVKQFNQALSRHGLELTEFSRVRVVGTEIGFGIEGKTRRAQLADAIRSKADYDAAEAAVDPHAGLDETELAADLQDEAAELAAEIAAAEDGTGPAKAAALRAAAEANTPTAAEIAGGTGNLVDGAVIPSGKDHTVVPSLPDPKPVRVKPCPECGKDMPSRYRICDDCLAKRHAAKAGKAS